jgi:hypothetical protein
VKIFYGDGVLLSLHTLPCGKLCITRDHDVLLRMQFRRAQRCNQTPGKRFACTSEEMCWTSTSKDRRPFFLSNADLANIENIHGFETIPSFQTKKPNCQTRTNSLYGLDAISAVQSKTPIGQTDRYSFLSHNRHNRSSFFNLKTEQAHCRPAAFAETTDAPKVTMESREFDPMNDDLPFYQYDQSHRGTGFEAGWSFSLNPGAPEWPQKILDAPLTACLSSQPLDSSWNHFDASFDDAGLWREWDNLETPASGTLERVGSTSMLHYDDSTPASRSQQLSDFTPEFFGDDGMISVPEDAEIMEAGRNFGGTAIQSDSNASISNAPPGAPPSRKPSQCKKSPTRKSTMSQTKPPRVSSQSPQTEPASSMIRSGNPSSRPIAQPRRASNPSSSTSSLDQPKSSTGMAKKKYHSGTEHRYRAKINDQFTALLEALPSEMVTSGAGNLGKGDRNVSKMEVLDLAQTYINTLEKRQSELTEESLVLNGQLQLLKRLFTSAGGLLMP